MYEAKIQKLISFLIGNFNSKLQTVILLDVEIRRNKFFQHIEK